MNPYQTWRSPHGIAVNELDCDIIVSHTITFTFILIPLGKV